jgi:hypothetical protein
VNWFEKSGEKSEKLGLCRNGDEHSSSIAGNILIRCTKYVMYHELDSKEQPHIVVKQNPTVCRLVIIKQK